MSETLVSAVAEKNAVEAQLAGLRLRIARGELVNRRQLELHYQAVALRIRDTLLAAPARYGPSLAAKYGLDPVALGIALDRVVRDLLNRLADEGDRRHSSG